MKSIRVRSVILFCVIAGCLVATLAPAIRAQESIGIDYFRSRLSPYGSWVKHDRLGWAWHPTKIAAGWRPYLMGRWIRTEEYGWYWQSDEDWGWATYHYGRWTYDAQHGWLWVPGTVWGPGWAAWRYGAVYVGWAPLPPGVTYDEKTGLRWGRVNLLDEAHLRYWVFVPGRLLLDQQPYRHALPLAQNRALLRVTRDATRFEQRNGAVFSRGPSPSVVTRRYRQRVPLYRTRRVNTPRELRRAIRRFEWMIRHRVIDIFRIPIR